MLRNISLSNIRGGPSFAGLRWFATAQSSKAKPPRSVTTDSPHPNYEVWVGLETHAQVLSNTKLFSGASTSFNAPPNSCTSLFDAALPGTLPRINSTCITQAIRLGLAMGGKINLHSHFDRKHYFYCDMPLGYQITQQDIPIVEGGSMSIDSLLPDGKSRTVELERIQLEQDSGKSLHDVSPDLSHIDLNRAGCALLEIVTRPNIRSADEAVAYLKKLQTLLRHLGTSTGNLEDGSFRCDVNVTVRRIDPPGRMTGRVEVKNMNSFKFIHRAIQHEARRQVDLCEQGIEVDRETRRYDPKTDTTFRLRSKENLLDYRFLPDPDLPILTLDPQYISDSKANLPLLLPDVMYDLFTSSYKLDRKSANILLGEADAAMYFLHMMDYDFDTNTVNTDMKRTAKQCFNWLTTDLFGRLKKAREDNGSGVVGAGDDSRQVQLLQSCNVSPTRLAELVEIVSCGDVSSKQAKDILDMMVLDNDSRGARDIAKEKGMLVDNDPVRIEQLCVKILELYPDEAETFIATGKTGMMGFLCGQTIKLSRQQKNEDGQPLGEANPKEISRIMQEQLDLKRVQLKE